MPYNLIVLVGSLLSLGNSVFSLGSPSLVHAVNGKCPSTHKRTAGERAPNPNAESLPTLNNMEARLDGFLQAKDPELKNLYSQLSNEIQQLKADIQRAREADLNTLELADLVDQYNDILVFPLNFLEEAAHRLDLDIKDWNLKALREVDEKWKRKRDSKGVSAFLPKYVEWYKKNRLKPLRLMHANFGIDGHIGPTGYPFFFDYTYIFKDGILDAMDFIRARENGIAYIGVASTMRADYDGQNGNARAFTNHDYFHAFFQKFKDNLLFSSLGIKEVRGVERLRAMNSEKLDTLLSHWEKITDPKLKASARSLLFALTHEQANSYPLQVHDELSDLKKREFYERVLPAVLSGENTIDPETSQLIKGQEKEYVQKAIEWLTPLVAQHAQELRAKLP